MPDEDLPPALFTHACLFTPPPPSHSTHFRFPEKRAFIIIITIACVRTWPTYVLYSEYGKESMGDVLWGHALSTKVLMEKGWGLGESEYAQKHHLQQVKLFTAIVAFSQKKRYLLRTFISFHDPSPSSSSSPSVT